MRYLLSSITSRIKSPILIYYLLVAIFLNRKVIFKLFYLDINSADKLAYFEANTTISYLLIYPLIIAIVYVLLLPWINFVFSFLTSKAAEKKHTLQADSEHRILVKKEKNDKVRASLLEAEEGFLVDRAKREDDIQSIKNDDIRERLQNEINQLRNNNHKNR